MSQSQGCEADQQIQRPEREKKNYLRQKLVMVGGDKKYIHCEEKRPIVLCEEGFTFK